MAAQRRLAWPKAERAWLCLNFLLRNIDDCLGAQKKIIVMYSSAGEALKDRVLREGSSPFLRGAEKVCGGGRLVEVQAFQDGKVKISLS